MIHSHFLCSQGSFKIHRHHDFQRMSGEPLYYMGKCVFCPWFLHVCACLAGKGILQFLHATVKCLIPPLLTISL